MAGDGAMAMAMGMGMVASLQSALRRCQWSPGVRTDSSHHGSGHASWHTSANNARHTRNRTLIHIVVQRFQLDVIVIVVAGTGTGALQGDDGLLIVAWLVLIQRLDIDGLQSVWGIAAMGVESLIATLAI